MFDYMKTYPIERLNMDDITKKNVLYCNPEDYPKLVVTGVVKLLNQHEIDVVQSNHVEEGNPIATGKLAIAVMKSEGVWEGE